MPTEQPSEEAAIAQTATPSADTERWPWWYALVALVLVGVAAGGFLAWRKRGSLQGEPADDWAEPMPAPARDVAPEPSPPARMPAPARANASPSPPTAPQPVAEPASIALPGDLAGLDISFQARLLRVSLVYVTLLYQLELANRTDVPSEPVTLRGDMIAAHASLGTRAQLAPEPAKLAELHEIPALQPGETRTLKGELRLPLSAVRPIQQGDQLYMAPLARIVMTGADSLSRAVFSVGRAGASAAHASIRIDAGADEITALALREIEAARLPQLADKPDAPLPLDPVSAAS